MILSREYIARVRELKSTQIEKMQSADLTTPKLEEALDFEERGLDFRNLTHTGDYPLFSDNLRTHTFFKGSKNPYNC